MRRLITNYGSLLETLEGKDKELVSAGRRVERGLRVVRLRGGQHHRVGRRACPARCARRRTRSTKVQAFAPVLRSSLESLRPAVRQLDTANREVLPFVREAEPIMRNADPAVRAHRSSVRARPAAGRGRPGRGDARPDRVVPPAQPLLQHGRLQPERAASRSRATRPRTATATRATCSGSAGWRRTRRRSSRRATRPARSAARSPASTAPASPRRCQSQPAAGAIIGLSNVLTPGPVRRRATRRPAKAGNDSGKTDGGISRNQDDGKKPEGLGTELEGRPAGGEPLDGQARPRDRQVHRDDRCSRSAASRLLLFLWLAFGGSDPAPGQAVRDHGLVPGGDDAGREADVGSPASTSARSARRSSTRAARPRASSWRSTRSTRRCQATQRRSCARRRCSGRPTSSWRPGRANAAKLKDGERARAQAGRADGRARRDPHDLRRGRRSRRSGRGSRTQALITRDGRRQGPERGARQPVGVRDRRRRHPRRAGRPASRRCRCSSATPARCSAR